MFIESALPVEPFVTRHYQVSDNVVTITIEVEPVSEVVRPDYYNFLFTPPPLSVENVTVPPSTPFDVSIDTSTVHNVTVTSVSCVERRSRTLEIGKILYYLCDRTWTLLCCNTWSD